MSTKSRNFLIGIGITIVLAFVLAGTAVLAYYLGRQSVLTATEAQESVVISVDDGEITIAAGEHDSGPQETKPAPSDVQTTEDAADEEETAEQVPTRKDGAEGEQQAAPESAGDEKAVDEARGPLELDTNDLKLLLEVWEIIDEEFDGALPTDVDVTYSAIAGSLELLDDNYTRFIAPDIAEHMREQLDGSFEGIGAFVDLNDEGYLVIVRPIEDQPADRAGLLSGDLITHVDGQSVTGKQLEEITAEIRGPEGTDVTLTVLRESLDEPFDVTVTRELIEIPIVSGEILEDDIAYVRLTGFSGNAAEQLTSKLTELLDQDPRALIFDLRDNPGGFLSQSVQVADLFLDDGVVLNERNGRDLEEVFESDDGDLAEEIELIVLVNAGSASASEIVAGAIQDRGRGILVGETTFGKGSVQQTHTLSDGSELRVTIARWYTPDNQSIDSDGISPDIKVATPEVFGGDEDTQLQKAIDLILQGS